MKQTFSLHRFQLLLKLHFAENGKHYLISSALLIGLFLVLMLPIVGTKTYSDPLYMLHILAIMLLFLGSSLFTSVSLSHYQDTSKGIQAIMLPASQPEKFASVLLINLLFVVLYFAAFWTMHFTIVAIANLSLPASGRKYFPIPHDVFVFFTYWYFLIQAIVMLGAIYFKKNAYVKTAGSLLIITIAAYALNSLLAYSFTGYEVQTFPFVRWMVYRDIPAQINFSESINTARWAFLILLIISFYLITFVRLREKEI